MLYQIIIPARYGSSRFPGKPLALLAGKPVICHVWERASQTGYPTVVATDDLRIYNAVTQAGGQAVMTRADHACGTDRLVEAMQKLDSKADVVINVQGDEPFVSPTQIKQLAACFSTPDVEIATLVRPFPQDAPASLLFEPSLVKVVTDGRGRALYFSRQAIPYLRGVEPAEWPARYKFLTHVGMYAYRRETLMRLPSLPPSPLEQAESLEQLRWLQAGLTIATAETTLASVGIDTPEDLRRAEEIIKTEK